MKPGLSSDPAREVRWEPDEPARPFLVQATEPGGEKNQRPRGARVLRLLLHRWHLLSLDAPTIATLWTQLIARSCGVELPATSLAAMFLAVWTLYAADRLLDARPLASRKDEAERSSAQRPHGLEARHYFHHRHRGAFLAALAGVVTVLGLLLPALPPAALRLDLLLGALLIGYFVAIHALDAAELPKEVAVGLFFAAAIFIPTVSRRPELRLSLLPVAALFAGLCSLNCVAIYRWEHGAAASGRETDNGARQSTSAHALTLWSVRHMKGLTELLTVVALLATALPGPGRVACAAIGLAGALLLLLERYRSRLSALTLRALADLALATPLAILLLSGLSWVLHAAVR